MEFKSHRTASSKYSPVFAAEYLIWQSTEPEWESNAQFARGARRLKNRFLSYAKA